MGNLLKETIDILEENKKTLQDIKWIGDGEYYAVENFEKILEVNYYSGFGCQEIFSSLKVVGDNWWLERGEYDGSEWWEFKQLPEIPVIKRDYFIVKNKED
jgi:hypothetical protein